MSETVMQATVETAQRLVSSNVKPGPCVLVPLGEALGRVLAEPVLCDIDYPPFDKVMMDGYAVRAADVSRLGRRSACASHADDPAGTYPTLRIVGRIAAGHEPAGPLGEGEAIQVNTGAPMPPGADAVVKVEDTERSADGSMVSVRTEVPPGRHMDPRGKYVSAGSVVIGAGTRMGPGQVAVAAAAGAAELITYRQPRVAILVTGDELVDISETPAGPQIRNSNGHMLGALVRGCHARPMHLGVVGDDRGAMAERIERGLEADLLCISGGISMGEFDFVPEVLAACGVRILVHKMTIKPGKPTMFGVTESGVCVFALAGNPIGCFVGFWLLVRGAIEAGEGRPGRFPVALSARLVGSCKATADRQTYLPVRLEVDGRGGLSAESLSWQGSGDPFGFCEANGLIVRPPGAAAADSGDAVSVIALEGLECSVAAEVMDGQ